MRPSIALHRIVVHMSAFRTLLSTQWHVLLDYTFFLECSTYASAFRAKMALTGVLHKDTLHDHLRRRFCTLGMCGSMGPVRCLDDVLYFGRMSFGSAPAATFFRRVVP